MNYECHITVSTEHAEKAAAHAKDLHWKTSEIARDPVLGEETYFYLTTHADNEPEIFARMERAVKCLEFDGVPVIRQKIEHIVFDTKTKVSRPEPPGADDLIKIMLGTLWEHASPTDQALQSKEDMIAEALRDIHDDAEGREGLVAALRAIWGSGFAAGADSTMKR